MQTVVGVNKYTDFEEEKIDVLKVDNHAVRTQQIKQLKQLREQRDNTKTTRALAAITQAAQTGDGNLLSLCVDAAREKATVGEMSDAMEEAFGRHTASVSAIRGIYSSELERGGVVLKELDDLLESFTRQEGRRPRILVAKMGQDGHDRGQKVIASAFADLGFDVDIGPLFQTPEEVAKQAIENDVHIIGASSLAAGHLTLLPDLRAALEELGRPDILIAMGGVIPPDDYQTLYDAGAAAIFPPGTVISEAAELILKKLTDNHGNDEVA